MRRCGLFVRESRCLPHHVICLGDPPHTVVCLYISSSINCVSLTRFDCLTFLLQCSVILRYNIERDVVAGKLEVADIPARWNADMKSLLDIDVPNDTKGCLQDIHWSCLAIGYFPTYLLGSMMAAQLAHYCRKDIPDMDDKIKAGEFDEIRNWLTKHVHSHGKRYKSLDELLLAEVGEELNAKYFLDYLAEKYVPLYKVE
jgi:carboxypeptidase Taq